MEVAYGARSQGLRNLVVTAKGREATYKRHFAARNAPVARGCVDAVIELEAFADILREDVQRRLLDENVIFVPNRSFEVYLRQKYTYDEIEERCSCRSSVIAICSKRSAPRAPSTGSAQDDAIDQYALLARAGIRHPRRFASPEEIDRLVMVKAPHARVSFERAFFLASTPHEYRVTSRRLIDEGIVTPEALASARIEEYALGPSVNLNFFYSPLLGELELCGTDTRRQTNLEGFRNIPPSALDALRDVPMRLEEAGHIAATILESMLEPAFEMGERFVEAAREARAARGHRSVRAAMRHRGGSAERVRLLRRLAANTGFTGNSLYAVLGLSLGARRFGRRAHRDGGRHGARHRSPRRCVDIGHSTLLWEE